jgi:cytochrome c oxidase subunit II
MTFTPTKTGVFHLFCAEYCGAQHSGMVGRVIVQTPEDYKAWLNGADLSDAPPEEAGRHLFTSLGCITCHGIQAPSMAGLFGRKQEVVTNSGKTEMITADESYLYESITNSTAKVVKGYQPIMPSYRPPVTISEDQVMQLIAYIRSLKDAKVGPAGDEVAQPATTQPSGEGIVTPSQAPAIRPGVGPGVNRLPQD